MSAAASLLLLSLVAAPARADDGPGVRGVLVGVDRFEDPSVPDLRYARSDAERFRDALVQGSGGAFTVDDLPVYADEDATLDAVRTAMRTALLDADADDVVVLYFSGHGDIEDGQGYLYAHDTHNDDMPATGLRVGELEGWVQASPARHVLLFTDACHAGSVGTLRGQRTMSRDAAFQEVIHSLDRSEGGVFNLASSLVRQQSFESWDYCGGGGAFTCALSEGLSGEGDLDGDARVTLAELSTFVQGRVMELTRYDQTPEAKGDYEPELVLAVAQDAPPVDAAELGVLGVLASGEGDDMVGGFGFGGLGVVEDEETGALAEGMLFHGQGAGVADEEDHEEAVIEGIIIDTAVDGGSWSEEGSWAEEEPWREPFRPYVVGGLHAVAAFGALEPGMGQGGSSLRTGPAGGASLVLGLRERWWFNPELRLSWLQTGSTLWTNLEEPVERGLPRVGVELLDRFALHTAVGAPYVVIGGGTWGVDVAEDDAGMRWHAAPLAGPWAALGGVGFEWMPWWAGSTSIVFEGAAVVQVGGVAGSASPAGRLSLGVETLL